VSVEYALVEPELDAQTRSMPKPRMFLLVESGTDCMLWEFGADGSHAGDTWHASINDARDQARFEVGGRLGDWVVADWEPGRAREEAQAFLASLVENPDAG
jgi:hypothetical protein